MEFQAPDRTLTDDEVAGIRALIEDRLAELGGRLRT
jgi:phenylalanyl-tRNA synthetase beta subunit